MLPLAPDRFSITTCCPSLADRSAARRRGGISIEPPAAKGTTMVIGREGQLWAAAVRDDTMLSSAAANAQRLGLLTVVSPYFILADSGCPRISRLPDRPAQAFREPAAHDPSLVLSGEECQRLGEMRDTLTIGRLADDVCQIGAPEAALGSVGIEQAFDMSVEIPERITLARIDWRRGHLDEHIGVPRERRRLLDRFLGAAFRGGRRRQSEMVDDEGKRRMPLRDSANRIQQPARMQHD